MAHALLYSIQLLSITNILSMKPTLTIITLFIIFIANSFAQDLIINLDTDKSKIEYIYINTEVGIFKISHSGKLQSVIIGDFGDNTLDIVDYFELRNKRAKLQIQETKIYVRNLINIDYIDDYYGNEISKNLPISINNYKFEYYDSFYDKEILKGKLKSIDNVEIEYYTDYYLNKKIYGKIKSIGNITISYYDSYINDEIIGDFDKIGNIKIKYFTNEYSKDYLNFKIKSIGHFQINYFDETLNTDHNGEFKNYSGSDSRFTLVNDY